MINQLQQTHTKYISIVRLTFNFNQVFKYNTIYISSTGKSFLKKQQIKQNKIKIQNLLQKKYFLGKIIYILKIKNNQIQQKKITLHYFKSKIEMSLNNVRRILSQQTLSYLKDKAKQSTYYGKYMATYVSVFTMLMKTCKGRDKICSTIQYIAQFYYHCNKYSEIQQVVQHFAKDKNSAAHTANKLRTSMKNSRKIFKFLKFIDQISSIVKTIQSKKPIYLKLITVLQSLMAFFSGMFDNIIWGINTQVLSTPFFKLRYKKFKANKYFFSLCKNVFKMLANNFKHHNRIRNMKQILSKLKNFRQDQLQFNSTAYQLCKDYLKHRMQVRIQQIDGAIMIFRIVMLARKLKLPGHQFVTKILYSACGLITTFISVYKMILDQPVLVEIQEKEAVPNASTQQEGKFEERQKVQKIKITRTGSFRFS